MNEHNWNLLQDEALERVFYRTQLWAVPTPADSELHNIMPTVLRPADMLSEAFMRDNLPITLEEFKDRAVRNTLLGCVMIHWCGMWLGIELDGYTHS